MEEALRDTPACRGFAELGDRVTRLPDDMALLRVRRRVQKHGLASDSRRVVRVIQQI
jgi:IS5 family transposase